MTKSKPIFYIVDESKYLKICEIEEEEGLKCKPVFSNCLDLKLKKEYFVSSAFDGSKEFSVVNDLVITKKKIIKMQPRGIENTELNTQIDFDVGS